MENCRLLAELSGEFGITVAMENSSGDNCLYSPEQFKEIIGEVNHPDFKMNLDIGHALCNDIEPCKFVEELGTQIVNVHTGNTPFLSPVLRGLENISYSGGIVLEHEEHNLRESFEKALRMLSGLDFDVEGINPEYVPEFNEFRIPAKEKGECYADNMAGFTKGY